MKSKDPLANQNVNNENDKERDTVSVISGKDGKETSRSKSSKR
jgi:hypothetical protein